MKIFYWHYQGVVYGAIADDQDEARDLLKGRYSSAPDTLLAVLDGPCASSGRCVFQRMCLRPTKYARNAKKAFALLDSTMVTGLL